MIRPGSGRVASALAWLAILACWLLLAKLAPAYAEPVAATAAAVKIEADRTRFVMKLTGALKFKTYTLSTPYRVVIDLPDVDFRLPGNTGADPAGLIEAFRYGLIGPGKSRIVIDTTGPVLVENAKVAAADGGAVLTLDLVATDATTFEAKRKATKKPKPTVTTDIVAIVPKPRLADPRSAKPLIVIDPGHGGPDSGAVSPLGKLEKDIVLEVGKLLRDRLNETGRYKVLMTRDIDMFIPLSGRVDFAQEAGADLFVSVHADATQNSRKWTHVRGGTVYTRSEKASDEQARLLALKENMADRLAGEDLPQDEGDVVSNIGADLARSETKALTLVLAEQIVGKMKSSVAMTGDAHRSAAFYVLKSPEIPSVLIELGFVNNKQDHINLVSASWRQKITSAIAGSIDRYFEERDKGLATLFGFEVAE